MLFLQNPGISRSHSPTLGIDCCRFGLKTKSLPLAFAFDGRILANSITCTIDQWRKKRFQCRRSVNSWTEILWVLLKIRQRMLFQHDGCPTHFAINVRNFWMSVTGELTRLNMTGGRVKNMVSATRSTTRDMIRWISDSLYANYFGCWIRDSSLFYARMDA